MWISADIYGLGGTFDFLLAGQPLFPEGQITQKLIWHQTRQPTPLRQLRPEVPAELAVIVERMIHKNPAQRYQTPSEVIDALTPWTATPLPLPPEEEMPRLSPAAGVAPPQRPRTIAELPTTPIQAAQIDTAPAGLMPSIPVAVPVAQPAPVRPSQLLVAPVAKPVRGRKPRRSSFKRRLFLAALFLTTAVLTGLAIHWWRSLAEPNAETTIPPSAPRASSMSAASMGCIKRLHWLATKRIIPESTPRRERTRVLCAVVPTRLSLQHEHFTSRHHSSGSCRSRRAIDSMNSM